MTFTTDPSVLAWMQALAPRPRAEKVGHHWWREFVTDAWRSADHAWHLAREAEAIGYATEEAEFAERHPRPRLADFMAHLSGGRMDPAYVYPEGIPA